MAPKQNSFECASVGMPRWIQVSFPQNTENYLKDNKNFMEEENKEFKGLVCRKSQQSYIQPSYQNF